MEMKKAILNTVDKRLTFIFRDKEFVVDVKGMDSDHWDIIKDERTNIEYDINIWFDEFYNGVNSFQLCVYELVMNHDETNLTIGNSLESYDVVAINQQGLIIDGDELELVMFGDSDKVKEVIEDNIKQNNNLSGMYQLVFQGEDIGIVKVVDILNSTTTLERVPEIIKNSYENFQETIWDEGNEEYDVDNVDDFITYHNLRNVVILERVFLELIAL
jgi:hypothetical protein